MGLEGKPFCLCQPAMRHNYSACQSKSGDGAHSPPAGFSDPLGIPGLIKYLVQTGSALGVGSTPGLKVHPKRSQGEQAPLPSSQAPRGAEEGGGGQEREEEMGKETTTNTGKKQINTESKEALAAAEAIKWDIKRISQLGSVPAKKSSVLTKKTKLTSLSLAMGGEPLLGKGSWAVSPEPGL